MHATTYADYFAILSQVPELKPKQLRRVTYHGQLPDNFAATFSSYRYVEGKLVKTYKTSAAEANQSRVMRKAAHDKIVAYKQQLFDLAALGLPTTSIGIAKLQALGRLSRKYLSGGATDTEQQLLSRIAASCYDNVPVEFLAKETVARVELLDETLLEFMAKGNPL
jgi:hypothetical protein